MPASSSARSSPAATSEPGLQHGDVRAGGLDLGEQVRGDDHRGPAGVQLRDDPPDVAGAGGVEPVGRLVEHDEAARQQQRRRQPEALLHAERVAAVPAVGRVGEPDPLQRLADGAGDRAPGEQRLGGRGAPQVLPAGQERVEPRALDQRADVRQRVRGGVRDGVPEQLRRARRRAGEAEQHPDQRRLARAVGPEHAEHGARRDVEVDARDGDRAAEDLAQPEGARRETIGERGGAGRGRRHRGGGRHLARASVSTCSGTAPAATRPSSVMIAVATAVVISRPLPHGPLTGVPSAERFGASRSRPGLCRTGCRQLRDDHGVPAVADDRRLGPVGGPGAVGLVGTGLGLLHRGPGRRGEGEQRRVLRAEVEVGEADLQRRVGRAVGQHGQPQREALLRVDGDPDLAQQRALGRLGGEHELVGRPAGDLGGAVDADHARLAAARRAPSSRPRSGRSPPRRAAVRLRSPSACARRCGPRSSTPRASCRRRRACARRTPRASGRRPRPSPSDQTRAVLVPFAACGRSGSGGRPSALSSWTVPANGPGFAVSTELTRSSAATGGSSGAAPAPDGTASRPSPTAPATAMPAATLRPAEPLRCCVSPVRSWGKPDASVLRDV